MGRIGKSMRNAGKFRLFWSMICATIVVFVFAITVLPSTFAKYVSEVSVGSVGFSYTSDKGVAADVFYGYGQGGYGFYFDPNLTVGITYAYGSDSTTPVGMSVYEHNDASGQPPQAFNNTTKITKLSQLLASPTSKGDYSWDYTIWIIDTYVITGEEFNNQNWPFGEDQSGGGFVDTETNTNINTLGVYPPIRRFNAWSGDSYESAVDGNTSNVIEFSQGSSGIYSLNVDGGKDSRQGTYIYVSQQQGGFGPFTQNGQGGQSGKYTWVSFANEGATINAKDASVTQDLGYPFNKNQSVSAVYIDSKDDLNGGPINRRPWQPDESWQPGFNPQSGLDITIVDGLKDSANNTCVSGVVNCSALYASGSGIYVGSGSTLNLGSSEGKSRIQACIVEYGNGGGIYVASKATLAVVNATLGGCNSGTRDVLTSIQNPWGAYGKGSVVYAEGDATVTFDKSVVQDNTGTAIFMDKGQQDNYSSLQIISTELSKNVNTVNKGSALEDAPWGGGAIMVGNASLLIEGSTISDNKSYGAPGGAIVVVGASAGVNHEVKNTTFSGNDAFAYGEPNSSAIDGGALYVYNEDNSTGDIVGCTFSNNTCSGNGGAIHIISPLSITDTNFDHNGAGLSGGAIYINMKNSNNTVRFTGGYSIQNKCAAGQENSTDLISGAALYVASGTLDYSSHYVHDNVSGNQAIGAAIYVSDQGASIIPNPQTGAVNTQGGVSKIEAVDTSVNDWMQWCYNNTRQDGTKADIYKASNSTLYVSTDASPG
jgi:predicted outer membrane repeat protein